MKKNLGRFYNWIVTFSSMSGLCLNVAAAADQGRKYAKNYIRPSEIPYPKDNDFSFPKQELGRTLFFDPRLSGSNWISCASCHNPGLSWQDGLPKGIGNGMKQVGRKTQTILNLAWGELYFWDERASTLEEQALGPIAATGEMNLPHWRLVSRRR